MRKIIINSKGRSYIQRDTKEQERNLSAKPSRGQEQNLSELVKRTRPKRKN